MSKRIPALAVAVAMLVALPLLAGCGSGSSSSNTSTASGGGTTTKQMSSGAATIGASSASGLGTILVVGGRTVYLFQRDTGPHSTCSGACATNWPPVTTTGAAKTGGGATASMLGTTRRADGTTQVTYAGHPLYYYAGDSSAGQTNGQGLNAFGAKWYVMAPSGAAVTKTANGGSGGGNGNSGGTTRYGY
jgi:predicted lipoprotein with Yx(FWY)xxD motif